MFIVDLSESLQLFLKQLDFSAENSLFSQEHKFFLTGSLADLPGVPDEHFCTIAELIDAGKYYDATVLLYRTYDGINCTEEIALANLAELGIELEREETEEEAKQD